MPERCRQTHEGEEWNCFFGYRVFPSIKSEAESMIAQLCDFFMSLSRLGDNFTPYILHFSLHRPSVCGSVAL